MEKKSKYQALNNQIFTKGAYSIVPIRLEDRYLIMKWRNEQLFHLRQLAPLTKENQDTYFNDVISKLFIQKTPNQILFSFLKDETCIGYGGLVHINWVDKNAEISFIMDTQLQKENFQKYWSIFLQLLEKLTFEELHLHKIYTYAFDIRPHLYEVLEKCNYKKGAVLKEHCFFDKKFIDVVIHEKINKELEIRKVNKKDVELLFNWSNDSLVRAQSFNTSKISYKEHVSWFDKKIVDASSLLLIIEKNKEPLGIVRFDIKDKHAVIGISVDENHRGKGLAFLFLELSIKKYFKENKYPILASIKKTNTASIKAFKRAGFLLHKETQINGIDSFVFKLTL